MILVIVLNGGYSQRTDDYPDVFHLVKSLSHDLRSSTPTFIANILAGKRLNQPFLH